MSITKFCCTVPGKIIIAGEHAVVFGHPALACTIALRTIANLEILDNPDIRLQMKTVNMDLIFKVNCLDSEVVEKLVFTDESVHDDFEIICGEIIPDLLSKEQRMSLSTSGIIVLNLFLYLLFGICGKKSHNGIHLTVDGEFPLASGLGSSASVSVAVATVLFGLSKRSVDIGSGEKKLLNEWSLRCEQFTHGKASGLDNYAVVYGGLTEAKNGTFKTIPYKSERLEVLLIDSGIPKCTKSAVANVKKYHEDFPNVVKGIFDSIGGVTNHVMEFLEPEVPDMSKIHRLLHVNHCLLKALGVSHQMLDEIVSICEQFGIGAKLTGGGGGGMVMALYDSLDAKDTNAIANIQEELDRRGFHWMITRVTNRGLELSSINK